MPAFQLPYPFLLSLFSLLLGVFGYAVWEFLRCVQFCLCGGLVYIRVRDVGQPVVKQTRYVFARRVLHRLECLLQQELQPSLRQLFRTQLSRLLPHHSLLIARNQLDFRWLDCLLSSERSLQPSIFVLPVNVACFLLFLLFCDC